MDHIQMARAMFGTNMAVHIIFATIGVGLPMMMLAAELMYQRTKDLQYVVMAKRWTKTLGVLLGVGIPTGTIAGVQLSDMTVEEAVQKLKDVLKEMTEEGAI